MRISFDLDDTLICYEPGTPYEPRLPWYLRMVASEEPLRHGARGLMHRLRQSGWEIWIYTTSYRNPQSVWWWLRCHGVRVGKVINQRVHDRHLKRSIRDYPPSKNPAAFGIDLHVDDSEGVRIEGRQHGFNVIVVDPADTKWTDVVWAGAERLKGRRG